jgi:hypothetical protein
VADYGVVLDTAALLAYTRGSELVGRYLAHVADRGEAALIPATCLATAYRDVDRVGWDLLDVLSGLTHAVISPLELEDCAVLGSWARTLGLDTAHAAIASARHAVTPLMTDKRDLICTVLVEAWPIVDI